MKLIAAGLIMATGTFGVLAFESGIARTTSFMGGILFAICWCQLIGGILLTGKYLLHSDR
ncbi:MAG TPA: hypothetical protein VNT75_26450 [Symbiobacteriaceae bacterium]|nr:hypothetical protein [Symbiobacteriaceae bacterium]